MERYIQKDCISDCCSAPVDEENICMKCNDKCNLIKECPECLGEGKVDVIDERRVHWDTITPPYKTIDCPKCMGNGFIIIET